MGSGDHRIFERNTVGVAIDSFEAEAKQQGIESLLTLHSNPDTVLRCWSAAESCYSLEAGVIKYDKIYRSVTDDD